MAGQHFFSDLTLYLLQDFLKNQVSRATVALQQKWLLSKRDGTCAETRFGLSAKRTSPFKSAWASVQSTAGSRGVRIGGSDGSNAGYTMFRGGVKGTGYPLHSAVSTSLPLPCVTVYHHVSTGIYYNRLVNRYLNDAILLWTRNKILLLSTVYTQQLNSSCSFTTG